MLYHKITLATVLAVITGTAIASSGELTYFHPGLGACGLNHGDGDAITAVSAILYDRSPNICGRRIRVSKNGRSAVVTVADRCTGCAEFDLDVSPSVFQTVAGDLGLGRTDCTWEFV